MAAKTLEFIVEIQVLSSQCTINDIKTKGVPRIKVITDDGAGCKGRCIKMPFHIYITHIIGCACENPKIGLFLGGGYR